jgi:PKD repeat protein
MSNPKIKFVVTPPPDADVENSDASYTDTVASGGLLVLPDSQINVNSVDSGDVVSVKTIDVNLTDGVDPVTPTSVGLVGNTLTIEVPSGGTPMDVDFSADKVVANIGETIAFTDLTDNSPTHWSWRFDNAGVSIAQNPTFSFLTTGFKNITLLAGKVGAGGVEIKNSFIEILLPLLLDAFPNAAAAYSLRKMRAAYTGSAIRVRRSSDNTEQNIGFNGSNGLDTTALLAFVGANNGFVTTFYDQSGNGYDLTQTTSTEQPQIVASGVVLLSNGLPTLKFDGTDDYLLLSTGILNNEADIYSSVVFDTTATTSNQIVHSSPSGTGAARGYDLRLPNTTQVQLAILTNPSSTSTNAIGTFNYSTGNANLITGVFNAGLASDEQKIFANGTLLAQTSNAGTSIQNSGVNGGLLLGRFGTSANFGVNLNGNISELVIYTSDKLADRTLIETNINTYYNVF